MLTLGPIAFAAPWILAALLVLPVLWWLLRVTPPAPRNIRFPAIRLLFGLNPEDTAARTPWWLLLLRLVAAALVILALAEPLLGAARSALSGGRLLLVIDDSFAAAPDWGLRQDAMVGALDRAEREGARVALLTTTASIRGEPPSVTPFLPATEARRRAAALRPDPWPPDRAAAAEAAEAIQGSAAVLYLTDGLEHGNAAAQQRLVAALQRLGRLDLVLPATDRPARILAPPRVEEGRLILTLHQAPSAAAQETAVIARTSDGRALARLPVAFAAGSTSAEATLSLPPELRNRLARLEIENTASAGAVALSDERWRRRPVGLVSGNPETADQPLLGDLYYLDRALAPFTELRRGTVRELLNREIAVIALADLDQVAPDEAAALEAWINRGGVLVRFAGPRLAAAPDPLLPVTLRAGDRTLGGALSWSQPAALAPFPADSPFSGLPVPEEVTIERQVLAEPSPQLAQRSWARLSDGTPLVTGERRGGGGAGVVPRHRQWRLVEPAAFGPVRGDAAPPGGAQRRRGGCGGTGAAGTVGTDGRVRPTGCRATCRRRDRGQRDRRLGPRSAPPARPVRHGRGQARVEPGRGAAAAHAGRLACRRGSPGAGRVQHRNRAEAAAADRGTVVASG